LVAQLLETYQPGSPDPMTSHPCSSCSETLPEHLPSTVTCLGLERLNWHLSPACLPSVPSLTHTITRSCGFQHSLRYLKPLQLYSIKQIYRMKNLLQAECLRRSSILHIYVLGHQISVTVLCLCQRNTSMESSWR